MNQIKDAPIKDPRALRVGQRVGNVSGEGRTGVVVSVHDDGSALVRLDVPVALTGRGGHVLRYYFAQPWMTPFLLDLDAMSEAKS